MGGAGVAMEKHLENHENPRCPRGYQHVRTGLVHVQEHVRRRHPLADDGTLASGCFGFELAASEYDNCSTQDIASIAWMASGGDESYGCAVEL